MKNAEKVMRALEESFKGHRIEMLYVAEQNRDKIFVDGTLVGYFDDEFFNADFDNPEIEIKVKAPIKSIKEFIDFASNYETIRGALERGFAKWEKESHPNN